MRLRVLPRMAGLYVLYIISFLIIVLIQFSRQTSFSRKVGNFTVSGQLRELTEDGVASVPGEYPINEYAKVSFGGIDFLLSNDANNPLFLVDEDGNRVPLTVDTLTVSHGRAHFLLSDGVELVFYTQESVDTNGLLISGILPEKAASIQLPYLPSAFAKISVDNAGRWMVSANNLTYTFDRHPQNAEARHLALLRDDPMVFYHTAPEESAFNPATFIVRGGLERTVYEEQVRLWTNKVYAVWDRAVPAAYDEPLMTAFLAEAVRRGTYQGVYDTIIWDSGTLPEPTFLSAPFRGRLDLALRTLSAASAIQSAQLSALIRTDPFLPLDKDMPKSETLPAHRNMMKEQGAYAAGTDAVSALRPAEIAAVFEGYNNWPKYSPNSENPFGRLVSRALELTAAGLIKDETAGNVFMADDSRVDIEFNLRLGIALAAYGDKNEISSWAGIGRSLVLSVLALTDNAGELPEFLTINGAGEILPDEAGELDDAKKIPAARIYPMLSIAAYYPHPVDLTDVQDGVWIWTAAPKTTAVFQNNALHIGVSFPVGGTHHLLIRGVNPFSKIQLRDMDYRTDPRFEMYNSPGWVYSASERTLLVKIVQRSEEEYIRIFY